MGYTKYGHGPSFAWTLLIFGREAGHWTRANSTPPTGLRPVGLNGHSSPAQSSPHILVISQSSAAPIQDIWGMGQRPM